MSSAERSYPPVSKPWILPDRREVCCSWASPPGELRLYWILVAWREVCYLDVVAPEIHVLACSSEVSFASPLGEAPFILLIVKLS